MKFVIFLILFFNFSEPIFCQHDTIWSKSFLSKETDKLDLFSNPKFKNLFFVSEHEVGLMDTELNLKYIEKSNYLETTVPYIYQDKLLFFKYIVNTNSGTLGYYVTKIANQTTILDTIFPFLEIDYYKEKKLVDKSSQKIIMKVLSSPGKNKLIVVYDNNYKSGIKEGFKFKILDENSIFSETQEVNFDTEDNLSEIKKFEFDGENIYCFVSNYDEKHNKNSTPSSNSIIKYNIKSRSIIKKNISTSSCMVNVLDFHFYNEKLFIINLYYKNNNNKSSLESIKQYSFDMNLGILDSSVTFKSDLNKLSIQDKLVKTNISGFKVAQRILPSINDKFPSYLINYFYTFEKSPFQSYPASVLSGKGLYLSLSSKGSLTRLFSSTTSNIYIENGRAATIFNDTILAPNPNYVNYLLVKNNKEKLLLHNDANNLVDKFGSSITKILGAKNFKEFQNENIIRTVSKIDLENNIYIISLIKGDKDYLIKIKLSH